MSDALTKKVIDIISGKAEIDNQSLTAKTSFVNDLNLDSLDIVEVVMELEDKFDIEVPEEKVSALATVQDVVNFLKENGKE